MIKVLDLKYEEYSQWEDLSDQDLVVINKAKEARNSAYANYSNFKVGAALLLDNGKILTGNNQENAAYPSGLCAERTAIFYTIANYPSAKIIKLAVVAGKDDNSSIPVSPCGACRQVLIEYEFRQKMPIEFLFTGMKGKVIKFNQCADLLPFSFNESAL